MAPTQYLINRVTVLEEHNQFNATVKDEPAPIKEETFVHYREYSNETENMQAELEYKITVDEAKLLLDHSKYKSAGGEINRTKQELRVGAEREELLQTVKKESLEPWEEEIVQMQDGGANSSIVKLEKETDPLQCLEELVDECHKDIKVECVFLEEQYFQEIEEESEYAERK